LSQYIKNNSRLKSIVLNASSVFRHCKIDIHLEILLNLTIKLLLILKNNFKGVLDDGKCDLNVKIDEKEHAKLNM